LAHLDSKIIYLKKEEYELLAESPKLIPENLKYNSPEQSELTDSCIYTSN